MGDTEANTEVNELYVPINIIERRLYFTWLFIPKYQN